MSVYRDLKGCGPTCLYEILQSQFERIYNVWAMLEIPSDNFGPVSIYNFELVILLNSV